MTKNQKAGVAGVAGLNAATIVFLYSHFVTVDTYNKLESKCAKTEERLSAAMERMAVLQVRSDIAYEAVSSRFE